MKVFKVKRKVLDEFLYRMEGFDPTRFKYHVTALCDDDGYTIIKFLSKKETKKHGNKIKGLHIEGMKYRVTGGLDKSERLGYGWYFLKGEIVECVSSKPGYNNTITYSGRTCDGIETQTMRMKYLPFLLEMV